jgi:hypothetical protein
MDLRDCCEGANRAEIFGQRCFNDALYDRVWQRDEAWFDWSILFNLNKHPVGGGCRRRQ